MEEIPYQLKLCQVQWPRDPRWRHQVFNSRLHFEELEVLSSEDILAAKQQRRDVSSGMLELVAVDCLSQDRFPQSTTFWSSQQGVNVDSRCYIR